jgi:hypothetical protein
MDSDELFEWWEENDGEAEDEVFAHHPIETFKVEEGLIIVLCLPYTSDESYQDEESNVNPIYLLAVHDTLNLLLQDHPEMKNKIRVILDFDDGSDGEIMAQDENIWDDDDSVLLAG